MMQKILVGWGVEPQRLILERESQNTWENIAHSLNELRELDILRSGSVIGICCQAFHARRALETARAVARDMGYDDTEIDFLIFAADTQGISRDNWHESAHGCKKVFGEIARLEEYLGVTIERAKNSGNQPITIACS